MIGIRPILLESGKDEVESFVNNLGSLIDESNSLVKETVFSYGKYQLVEVNGLEAKLMVDGLGRIIVPNNEMVEVKDGTVITPTYVKLGIEKEVRQILRTEPVYKNDDVVAWVFYIEKRGAENEILYAD